MTNQLQTTNDKKPYDITVRASQFGEDIIGFVKTIPDTTINRPLISQAIMSGTSIGANCMEADCAESGKDFVHKLSIAKKEARETEHWLNMLAKANPEKNEQCQILGKEAHELMLIISSIILSHKNGKKRQQSPV